ncbi:SDR family NAD(P)-dependent oxidoreductase [Sphingomonas morindae]|uniref:SDR family NAD(P)-dependent oxidoreductase n=1 Tax=Sphingomonas morindae TaxID=1541170 RepID=A0ABY4X9F4_9SPHN|nr:SDR family NAD(P)-dependent oxidoreductase [Sphingomonas morindae]USI73555.1 SDR family NAD(P)-dependent oxidoreductase [Sphingomonas morindae]
MAKVLMTGGNGAFGGLAARAVLGAGHQLAAAMRDPGGRNAQPAAALRALGATVVEIDVTDDGSVAKGSADAIEALGGLDILVNIAGVGTHGLSEGYGSAQLSRLFDLNVIGVHRMMRAVLPTLRRQQAGLVINISSLLGRLSLPFYGPYSATKFALESLSDTYRAEVSQFGVDVVLLEPGGFKTTWIEALVHPEDTARLAEYGAFAEAPAQTLAQVEAMLDAKPEQDPAKVAEAILALVDAPAGARPQRTTVDFIGMAQSVEMINGAAMQATTGVYQAFGCDDLLTLKVR